MFSSNTSPQITSPINSVWSKYFRDCCRRWRTVGPRRRRTGPAPWSRSKQERSISLTMRYFLSCICSLFVLYYPRTLGLTTLQGFSPLSTPVMPARASLHIPTRAFIVRLVLWAACSTLGRRQYLPCLSRALLCGSVRAKRNRGLLPGSLAVTRLSRCPAK